jgi:hypothetical protein
VLRIRVNELLLLRPKDLWVDTSPLRKPETPAKKKKTAETDSAAQERVVVRTLAASLAISAYRSRPEA